MALTITGDPVPARCATATGSFSNVGTGEEVVTGSDIDTANFLYGSVSVKVATAQTVWSVYMANSSDFSDEKVAFTTAVTTAAGASSGWGGERTAAVNSNMLPYRYYRIKTTTAAGTTVMTWTWFLKSVT